jgi:hypothetical protein
MAGTTVYTRNVGVISPIIMSWLLISSTCRSRILPNIITVSASSLHSIPFHHKRQRLLHNEVRCDINGIGESSFPHLRGGGEKVSIFRTYNSTSNFSSDDGDDEGRNSTTKSKTSTAESSSTAKCSQVIATTLTTKPQRKKNRLIKLARQGLGGILSTVGFVTSSVVALATDRLILLDRTRKPLQALQQFLQTSGVDLELSQSLNRHLAMNFGLLRRVHHTEQLLRRRNSTNNNNSSKEDRQPKRDSKFSPAFWEEARRYMRYATAVYGQAMIHAAQVDATGRLDGKLGQVTLETISQHIGVPAKDIVLIDVDYDGDTNHLRHFVALDHEHGKIVLSIRGTFSLQEIVVDVAGFSRNFCGGEGHSEIATMAERVWTVAGPTVQTLQKTHPNYEFIVTGHSLGAGTFAK